MSFLTDTVSNAIAYFWALANPEPLKVFEGKIKIQLEDGAVLGPEFVGSKFTEKAFDDAKALFSKVTATGFPTYYTLDEAKRELSQLIKLAAERRKFMTAKDAKSGKDITIITDDAIKFVGNLLEKSTIHPEEGYGRGVISVAIAYINNSIGVTSMLSQPIAGGLTCLFYNESNSLVCDIDKID